MVTEYQIVRGVLMFKADGLAARLDVRRSTALFDAKGNRIGEVSVNPGLTHNLPTDPETIQQIKDTERKRRSCCDRPEGT